MESVMYQLSIVGPTNEEQEQPEAEFEFARPPPNMHGFSLAVQDETVSGNARRR
jgi:hypothetical protein